jgi:hypothetical protein
MKQPTAKPLLPWATRESLIALVLGGVLGQMVSYMADQRPGQMFSVVMAIVCVLASSASLVIFLLHTPSSQPLAQRAAQVPTWLIAIGTGLLLTLRFS